MTLQILLKVMKIDINCLCFSSTGDVAVSRNPVDVLDASRLYGLVLIRLSQEYSTFGIRFDSIQFDFYSTRYSNRKNRIRLRLIFDSIRQLRKSSVNHNEDVDDEDACITRGYE